MNAGIRLHPRTRPLSGKARVLLAALEGFICLGALYGGIMLLADAEGFGIEESWLAGTPFPDYRIPGLVLLVVIGGGMLVAALAALVGSAWAALAAFCMGVTTLGFLVVETLLIGYRGSTQLPLLVAVGIPALVLVRVGWRAVRAGPDGAGEAAGSRS